MGLSSWTYEEKLCYIAHLWADKEKIMLSLQDFDYVDMTEAAIEFIRNQPDNIEFTAYIENCFNELDKEHIGENSHLRENFTQSVNGAIGKSSKLTEPQRHVYVMVLCMVELGAGINLNQILEMLALLSPEKRYIHVEFHAANTSAYGYIESEYYEGYNYASDFLENMVLPVIDDKNLESPDGVYTISDGRYFYMGYFNV